MKNSNLLKFSVIAFLFIAFFAACKKDEAPTPTTGNGDFSTNNGMAQIVSRNNESDSLGLCFEIGFPITVEFPDGSTQVANSMEEIDNIYNTWFEQNPNANTCPTVVYPLSVTLEDGTTHTVASEDELIVLIEDCLDLGWEDCFQIQYPVTVLYPDGTTAVANSDGQLANAMDDWYETHPNDSLYPTIAFPIMVLKADGTTVEIVDENGMNALFEDCFGTVDPGEPVTPCFEYVFPMTVAYPDGSTVSANGYAELDSIFMAWFENNPNATEFPTIAYPMTLQLENGDLVTVHNDEELSAIFNDCFGGGGDPGEGGFEDCFTFNYPLTLVFPDGSAPAINNDDELWTAVFDWFENNPDDEVGPSFQYPISVTLTADGSVVTVNNDDELNAIFEGCYDCVINNGEGLVLQGKHSVAAKAAVKQHAKLVAKAKHSLTKTLAKKAAGK
jgi:hypothetical protein